MTTRFLAAALFFFGLYLPTSLGGVPSGLLFRLGFAVIWALLAIIAYRVRFDVRLLLISGAMFCWLWLCTIPNLFGHSEFTFTPVILFGSLAFLLSLRVGKMETPDLSRCLAFFSVANVLLAVGMIVSGSVGGFMVSFYNDFTDDLAGNMLTNSKPVLTFATHSLAGVFVYLFFWLNLRTYQKLRKKLHLLLALAHVCILIALLSFTSLGLALLAIAELAWNFRKTALVSGLTAFFMIPVAAKERIGDAFSLNILLREGGGFIGRYTHSGNLAAIFAYIHDNPFSPIGLTAAHKLFAEGGGTDSGPLMYFLRGSLPLVLLIYGGFFLFLRRNLADKWDVARCFGIVLIAELGITVLTYQRAFLLIPAMVAYLNSISSESRRPAVGASLSPSNPEGRA